MMKHDYGKQMTLMENAQLREMFRGKATHGEYEACMRAFCKRKYNSDFSRERSVAEYLKQYDQQQ